MSSPFGGLCDATILVCSIQFQIVILSVARHEGAVFSPQVRVQGSREEQMNKWSSLVFMTSHSRDRGTTSRKLAGISIPRVPRSMAAIRCRCKARSAAMRRASRLVMQLSSLDHSQSKSQNFFSSSGDRYESRCPVIPDTQNNQQAVRKRAW
jgi:hypothetical protein